MLLPRHYAIDAAMLPLFAPMPLIRRCHSDAPLLRHDTPAHAAAGTPRMPLISPCR